jgi:hypothetical protein
VGAAFQVQMLSQGFKGRATSRAKLELEKER